MTIDPKNQEQEIRRRFDTLPKPLKNAIANLEMGEIAEKLRQKYNIHVDQLGKIAEEITLTMVGLTRPSNFGQNIKNKTGLADDIVNLITYDLNQEIFFPIRQELENLSSAQDGLKEEKDLSLQIFQETTGGVSNLPQKDITITPEIANNKITRDPYREPIE